MIEKECSKCKVVKPFDAFHKCKRAKYGFAPWCKECKKEFYDTYNLLALGTFKMCLLCCNNNNIVGELNKNHE